MESKPIRQGVPVKEVKAKIVRSNRFGHLVCGVTGKQSRASKGMLSWPMPNEQGEGAHQTHVQTTVTPG